MLGLKSTLKETVQLTCTATFMVCTGQCRVRYFVCLMLNLPHGLAWEDAGNSGPLSVILVSRCVLQNGSEIPYGWRETVRSGRKIKWPLHLPFRGRGGSAAAFL